MVDDGGAVIFPVVFYDGEREINIGNVMIHPSIVFKTFQSILSQKIGISANQFTIYLVEGKRSKISPDYHRKMLVTGKANFALIARGNECFFLVVLKRSRRDRRRKPKQSTVELSQYLPENTFSRSQWPENMLLLRRNEQDHSNLLLSDLSALYYNQIAQTEYANYDNRWQNFSIDKENCTRLISNANWGSSIHLGLDSIPRIKYSDYAISNRNSCKDCTKNANNKQSPAMFHICVNDPITEGFRSPAGPVTPPAKASQ